MKHLSRDKLAKHHRFSYIPRYYKGGRETFEHKVSTIKRQLDNNVAVEEVTSKEGFQKIKKGKQPVFILVMLIAAILTTLIVMPLSVYSVALLFIFVYAFIKLSKKK